MKFRRNHFYSAQSAFTMVEIAISLAVIGIALVAIIGVLPIGMNVQKDNREETVIDQDATVFIEAIRGGGTNSFATDLTNYVYLITNTVTPYSSGVAGTPVSYYGYTLTTSFGITNNARIIGLLSTPEYTDSSGAPSDSLAIFNGNYYSNHVVAYVHSISGPAVEKPPQDNDILRSDSFSYKIICDNVPVAVDTNIFNLAHDQPSYIYAQQLTANLHELRLTFLWPLLPSGNTGAGRQTFRTMIGGQLVQDANNNNLYFFQSQSFTNILSP